MKQENSVQSKSKFSSALDSQIKLEIKSEGLRRIETIYFSKRLKTGVANIKDGDNQYVLTLEQLKYEPPNLIIDFIQSLLLSDVTKSEQTY